MEPLPEIATRSAGGPLDGAPPGDEGLDVALG